MPMLYCGACASVQSSTNDDEHENVVPDEKKSDTKNTNSSKIKTGFYSGFSLGIKKHSMFGILSPLSGNDLENQRLNLDKSHLAVNLSVGADKNFGPVVVGADVNVAFNPGSEIEYPKKEHVNIANFKVGTEYLVFGKLGVALGRFQLYSKFGGSLSHAKYDWKLDHSPKDNSNCMVAFAWGGGLEYRLSDSVLVNLDFLKYNKSSVDKLNVKTQTAKTSDTTVASYQITMGCGYRF